MKSNMQVGLVVLVGLEDYFGSVNIMQKKVNDYMKRFPQVKQLRVYPCLGAKRYTAVFLLNNKRKVVHFGMKGGFTYLDGASEKKRNSYKARASKITNSEGMYTYRIPGTANSFSYWLLW